jgi:hypothetical protein
MCGKLMRLWRHDRRYCTVGCRVAAYDKRCRAAYRAAKAERQADYNGGKRLPKSGEPSPRRPV